MPSFLQNDTRGGDVHITKWSVVWWLWLNGVVPSGIWDKKVPGSIFLGHKSEHTRYLPWARDKVTIDYSMMTSSSIIPWEAWHFNSTLDYKCIGPSVRIPFLSICKDYWFIFCWIKCSWTVWVLQINTCIHHISINWPQASATCGLLYACSLCIMDYLMVGFLI